MDNWLEFFFLQGLLVIMLTTPTAFAASGREAIKPDLILSHEPRHIVRAHKLELTPSIAFQINDPYTLRYFSSIAIAYYFNTWLGLSLAVERLLSATDSASVGELHRTYAALMLPRASSMLLISANLSLAVLSGKIAVPLQNITYFDMLISSGTGMTFLENSRPTSCFFLAATYNLKLKNFLLLRWELKESMFLQSLIRSGQPISQVVHQITTAIGFSFLMPVSNSW